ncbi:MAG: hypothetical protein WBE71_03000 [Xanthobacteraceae bacterium]
MSNSNLIVSAIFCALVSIFSFSANAFELDGAWATDSSQCSKMFAKKHHTISLTPKSDIYGSGFIVEGNRIRGKLLTCEITDRKQAGAVLDLAARCSTSIALLSPTELSLKIDDDNHITRTLTDFDMSVTYARCTF